MDYGGIRMGHLRRYVEENEGMLTARLGPVAMVSPTHVEYIYRAADEYPYVLMSLEAAPSDNIHISSEIYYRMDVEGNTWGIGCARLCAYYDMAVSGLHDALMDDIGTRARKSLGVMVEIYPACLRIIRRKFPWLGDVAVNAGFCTFGILSMAVVHNDAWLKNGMSMVLTPSYGVEGVKDVVIEEIRFKKLDEDKMADMARSYLLERKLEAL